MPDRVKDKVAIVTGGASGLGEAEAKLLAREGAKVCIMDLREDLANPIVETITKDGGQAIFVKGDVSQEADWHRVVATTTDCFGSLNILVNNAGVAGRYFDAESVEDWRKIMDINMTSVFIGTKSCVGAMRKSGGGAIVNISSVFGIVALRNSNPAYSSSKGAIRIYTKASACAYAADNIRVNSVHPGFMQKMLAPDPTYGPSEGQYQQVNNSKQLERVPLGRIGMPIEVANGVVFLASDEASYITGAELNIDGGFLAG